MTFFQVNNFFGWQFAIEKGYNKGVVVCGVVWGVRLSGLKEVVCLQSYHMVLWSNILGINKNSNIHIPSTPMHT